MTAERARGASSMPTSTAKRQATRVMLMDNLAKRLREDADQIDVAISPELDDRIYASLQGIRQEADQSVGASRRPASFWWASSLTGVAAALVLVTIVNLQGSEPEIAVTEPPVQQFSIPQFNWKPKPAMLTETLEQELEDIQSDLKKAEQAVKEDFDEIM